MSCWNRNEDSSLILLEMKQRSLTHFARNEAKALFHLVGNENKIFLSILREMGKYIMEKRIHAASNFKWMNRPFEDLRIRQKVVKVKK